MNQNNEGMVMIDEFMKWKWDETDETDVGNHRKFRSIFSGERLLWIRS